MTAIMPVYRRSDIEITRGEGPFLYAQGGTRYIDFATGIAVNALGHCHPHVVAALKAQADQLWHCSNMYQMPGLTRYAQRLCDATFADKAFFCNSGGEAVECGIKIIRKYFHHKGEQHRNRIITMENGFHGRSMACISAGGNEIAREGYGPLLEGFDRVPFNNIAAAEAAITKNTAGIMLEPVQCEGGIHVGDSDYLKAVRELATKHGLLLFFDEVQCGMGRTGSLYEYQQHDITPDVLTSAKGIGNGFPLAACLVTDEVASCMHAGAHGSTYGSNPMAMAVGNAVLDIMLQKGFFEQVQARGIQLREGLEKLAKDYPTLIEQVRGKGLMLGIKTKMPRMDLVEHFRNAKLLTSPAQDNTIRIVPPLTVTPGVIEEAVFIMNNTCKDIT